MFCPKTNDFLPLTPLALGCSLSNLRLVNMLNKESRQIERRVMGESENHHNILFHIKPKRKKIFFLGYSFSI